MFIIARQAAGGSVWLASLMPQRWGERDRAMRFATRGEGRRAAATLKIAGDWSIQATG